MLRRFVHVFSRGVDKKNLFLSERDYARFLLSMWLSNFERSPKPSGLLRFLDDPSLDVDVNDFVRSFGRKSLTVAAFCLMPNHYHLLLSFSAPFEKVVSPFMQRLNNGYSHFFNAKNNREGRLFGSSFKWVEVESEGQLKHLSRYIHCNPAGSAELAYNEKTLPEYPFSSLPLYLGKNLKFSFGKEGPLVLELADICDPADVLMDFKDDSKKYWQFCRYGVDIKEDPALSTELVLGD